MGKAAITREKIFLAAVDCITEQGYGATTVNDIADRIGIKAASLYYHFKSKDAILAEIFDYYIYHFNQYRTPPEAIAEIAKTAPLSDVFALMSSHFGDEDEYALMTKIARIIIDLKYEDPAAKKIFQRCFIDDYRAYLVRTLNLLKREKVLLQLDPEPLAAQIAAFSLMNLEQTLLSGRTRKEDLLAYNAGVAFLADLVANSR